MKGLKGGWWLLFKSAIYNTILKKKNAGIADETKTSIATQELYFETSRLLSD